MSAQSAWLAIPEHLRGSLSRYLVAGLQPGGFMTSFLENDLVGAISRADETAIHSFREIGQFLECYAPRGAHGHSGCVLNWQSISTESRTRALRRDTGDAFNAIIDDSGLDIGAEISLERVGA